MSGTISKEAAERLKEMFSRELNAPIFQLIDGMTEPEPHEWKAGEWLYDPILRAAAVITEIDENRTFPYILEFTTGQKNKYNLDYFSHRGCTPISAPKFEVGQRVRCVNHDREDGVFNVIKREWINEFKKWRYSGSSFGGYDFEERLEPAPEWEPGMWAEYGGCIYPVDKVDYERQYVFFTEKDRWVPMGYCQHVHHLQWGYRKCICGEDHEVAK